MKAQNQTLQILTCALALAGVALGVYNLVADARDDYLVLRQLTIVDEAGTPRVQIGAPVPNPLVPQNDKMVFAKRAAPLHGITIHAADGSERGGYGVTDESKEAILTLDEHQGGEVFRVNANPKNGATMGLYNQQTGATVLFTTYKGHAQIMQSDGNDGDWQEKAIRNLIVEGDDKSDN